MSSSAPRHGPRRRGRSSRPLIFVLRVFLASILFSLLPRTANAAGTRRHEYCSTSRLSADKKILCDGRVQRGHRPWFSATNLTWCGRCRLHKEWEQLVVSVAFLLVSSSVPLSVFLFLPSDVLEAHSDPESCTARLFRPRASLRLRHPSFRRLTERRSHKP